MSARPFPTATQDDDRWTSVAGRYELTMPGRPLDYSQMVGYSLS